ncbi:MAG: helix-turn-helix domain-containing protein [Dehalococcoidia bacterium]
MLHAHPNSIRSWSDSGLLPAVRIGRRGDRRFRRQDVERFLRDAGGAQYPVARSRS